MGFEITPALLRKIEPGANQWVIDALAPHLNKWMPHYSIDSTKEIHHFLPQLGHESAHFRTLTEYADGSAYEGRRDLGNVYAGDGRRYKGRGPIQCTGRNNYRFYGQRIGVDLENNPEKAAEPEIGVRIACEYWTVNGLGKIAETDRGIVQGPNGPVDTTEIALQQITKRINGGYNGLADRRNCLRRVMAAIPGASFAPVNQVKYQPAPVAPNELPQGPIAAPAADSWWSNSSIQATGASLLGTIINGVNNPYSLAAIALVVLAGAAVGFAFYRKNKRDAEQFPKAPVLPTPEAA
jgi:putative chitinase